MAFSWFTSILHISYSALCAILWPFQVNTVSVSSPLSDLTLATAWKVSRYGVFLVRIFQQLEYTKYLSVFSPNAGKYGPGKTPYLDTFHTVSLSIHFSNVYVTVLNAPFNNGVTFPCLFSIPLQSHFLAGFIICQFFLFFLPYARVKQWRWVNQLAFFIIMVIILIIIINNFIIIVEISG